MVAVSGSRANSAAGAGAQQPNGKMSNRLLSIPMRGVTMGYAHAGARVDGDSANAASCQAERCHEKVANRAFSTILHGSTVVNAESLTGSNIPLRADT